ncbi:hypothetical protein MUP01_00925 [Candidatus Bathyarchaeota archaeon]|nr:hypothetical protein [Candidatus Bathyarchaeota archaeon]
MKEPAHHSLIDCEYLVGDDSCRAVKETDLGVLREDACHNDVKDACCYLCNLREDCDIKCDLLDLRKAGEEPEKTAGDEAIPFDLDTKMECQNCVHYLKPRCPRGYSHDTELWRRQDPCEIFKPIQKAANRADNSAEE